MDNNGPLGPVSIEQVRGEIPIAQLGNVAEVLLLDGRWYTVEDRSLVVNPNINGFEFRGRLKDDKGEERPRVFSGPMGGICAMAAFPIAISTQKPPEPRGR